MLAMASIALAKVTAIAIALEQVMFPSGRCMTEADKEVPC